MTSVEHHPLVGEWPRSAGAATRDARARIAVGRIRDEVVQMDEVINSGIEIATRDRTRLYHSPEQRTLRSGQHPWGSGLGLARTKRLVEMHGEAIDVESELGAGTTFAVRIPVA